MLRYLSTFFTRMFLKDSSDTESAIIIILGTNGALLRSFVHDYLKVEIPDILNQDKIYFEIGVKQVYVCKVKYFSSKSLQRLEEQFSESANLPKYCYLVNSRSNPKSFISKRTFVYLARHWNAVAVKQDLISSLKWEPMTFDEFYKGLDTESVATSSIMNYQK